jgi:hypothetical protein
MKPTNKQQRILVLGGYGTFGSRIVRALCADGFQLLVNGRSSSRAKALLQNIMAEQADANITVACFDVFVELAYQLQQLKPQLVIHCCGPFQGQDTSIAKTIIDAGIHYIDLSDGRDYVQQMLLLDECAKQQKVTAITAASTVPTLSAAVLFHLQQKYQIQQFDEVRIGISPGQKTVRGLATTEAVLSYIGKPLQPWNDQKYVSYGWQDTYLQVYPKIKNRLMGNCESADLDCLPQYFSIKKLTFSAGMESKLLHISIWFCSWLIRLGLPLNLPKQAAKLLSISRWFDHLGSEDGGMHVYVKGHDSTGNLIEKTWFVIAKNNDGPHIPSIPAVVLAKKILAKQIATGVRPSINEMTLEAYCEAFKGLAIETHTL